MRNLALLRALLALTVGYAVVWALFVGRHVELDPLPHNVTRQGVRGLLGAPGHCLVSARPSLRPAVLQCRLRAGSQYVSTGGSF